MAVVSRLENLVTPWVAGEYLDLQRKRAMILRRAPGCEGFVMARNLGDGGRYRTLTRWESFEAARASGAVPDVSAGLAAIEAIAPLAARPAAYDVVHTIRGRAFSEGVPPGVVTERDVILKPGSGTLAAEYAASRKGLFEIVAKESAGLWGHTLLRHRGSPHCFRVVNSYRSREDSPMWAGPTLPPESPVHAFVAAHPDSLYTDVPTYFEHWQPVPLT